MTKAQELARARLIAYAQQPDVYYPPTPKECREAWEFITELEKAKAELVASLQDIVKALADDNDRWGAYYVADEAIAKAAGDAQ